MITLSRPETSGKALNPSALNYFPLHHTRTPLPSSKHLLPPPHLCKLLPPPPPPYFYLPSPQYYLSEKLFQTMPELILPHQIVWAPVMTRVALPGNSGTQPEKKRPAYRPDNRRSVPPRLQVWRRKKADSLAPAHPLGNSTTVMIRNIPNRLRQHELVTLLAEHCLEMNKSTETHKSEFDLVYLPVDFTRLGNKGYAFVNFTTASGANGLHHAWNNLGWKNFDTRKTRRITTAAIQGKEKLKERLERSLFDCDTDAYLAVELTPPCDGSNLLAVKTSTIGRRVKVAHRHRRSMN